MKRISTLAGMAASPVSASLSVVSSSAGGSRYRLRDRRPGGTRRRVDGLVRRPVHRHVGADGPNPQGGALRVAGRGQPPPRLRVARFLADVACAVGIAPCLNVSDAQGFAIDEAEVMCWGSVPRPLHRTKFLNPPP
jgi:hypothetical protein